jgi:hypothetical protein
MKFKLVGVLLNLVILQIFGRITKGVIALPLQSKIPEKN